MAFNHETWIRVAEVIAQESKATRLKVGCVVVKDDRIVSTVINGMPPGFPNECDDENGSTKPEVLHAESAAIAFAARHNGNLLDSVIYCSHSPCHVCAGLIRATGVRAVYYRTSYRDDTGVRILRDAGVTVERIV